MSKTHLSYCMRTAQDSGENRHPEAAMKSLGIKYQHATPQSINESWWFWNCENLPDELPPYLKVKHWDPMEMVGWGLSQETAERIRDAV